MKLEEKIKYNKASAYDYGWSPEWFGLHIEQFDQRLIEIIEEFQYANDLDPDGMIGPSTFRRLYTYVSQDEAEHNIKIDAKENPSIIFRGEKHPIMWSKVVLWNEKNGLTCKSKKSRNRKVSYFVNHWDVCLSSKQMAKVLRVRSLGVHFAIDNDATIYQLCDIEDLAFHAGGHNSKSIGVELSNAYSLDYNSWYEKKGFGKRPVINSAYVHGRRLKAHLGFYPEQLQALCSLWAAVSLATGIPLRIPKMENKVDLLASSGDFIGFCAHYHLTRKKIDPAGLNFHAIQDRAALIKLAMSADH